MERFADSSGTSAESSRSANADNGAVRLIGRRAAGENLRVTSKQASPARAERLIVSPFAEIFMASSHSFVGPRSTLLRELED